MLSQNSTSASVVVLPTYLFLSTYLLNDPLVQALGHSCAPRFMECLLLSRPLLLAYKLPQAIHLENDKTVLGRLDYLALDGACTQATQFTT